MAEKKEVSTKKCRETIFLQFNGNEVCIDEIREAIKDDYDAEKKGNDPMEDLKIYLKPEDDRAYYVVNEDYAGEVDLPLE